MTASYVIKNTVTKTEVSRVPIPLIKCTVLAEEMKRRDLKTNPSGVQLEHQDCIVFPKGTVIGTDKENKLKKTV